jgi:hypothetical protein
MQNLHHLYKVLWKHLIKMRIFFKKCIKLAVGEASKNYWGWAGGVAQVVEHLPSKCKALSSYPSTAKKKGRKEGKVREKEKGRKEERRKKERKSMAIPPKHTLKLRRVRPG